MSAYCTSCRSTNLRFETLTDDNRRREIEVVCCSCDRKLKFRTELLYVRGDQAYETYLRAKAARQRKAAKCRLCGYAGQARDPEWYWCGVCAAQVAAVKHERMAAKFRVKERELRARRAKQKGAAQ